MWFHYYAWHEQNIACSKTLKPLFLKAVICRSSGGLSANRNEEKMHRMTIRVNYTLATCRHVQFQPSSFVQYGNEDMMLMNLSSWVLESIYGRIEVCIHVNSSFKLVTSFSTSTNTQISRVPLQLQSTTLLSYYSWFPWRCDWIFGQRT